MTVAELVDYLRTHEATADLAATLSIVLRTSARGRTDIRRLGDDRYLVMSGRVATVNDTRRRVRPRGADALLNDGGPGDGSSAY